MPDLQTALSNVLNEWAKDDQPVTQSQPQPQEKQTMTAQAFTITNNVSRATFDFVRDNPGLFHNDIKRKLTDKGYKESSVTALISQLRRAGQLARLADGTYHATAKEYAPIKQAHKQAKTKKPVAKKPVAKKVATPEPKSEGIAALQPVAAPVTTASPVVISNDVEYILSTLPIKQARSLYDELHKIFGVKV
jgi:hypothetical protein